MAITLVEDVVNRFIVNSPADHTAEEYSGNTNVSAINSVLVYSRENVKVFARVTATQVWETLGVVGNDLDSVSGHGTEYRKDAVFNVTTMDRVSIISLGAETTARIVFNPSLPTEGLENAGALTSMGGTMTAHILPDTNAIYDLGSAEKKIRHLFLSDNSLWVGDEHKVSISGGKMKFRKRKKSTVPAAVAAASGDEGAALAHAGVATLADMKLEHWREFMRTLPGQGAAEIKDIFRDNSEDYEDDFEAGAASGGSSTSQTIVSDMAQDQSETITIDSGTTPIIQIFEEVPPVAGSEVLSYTGSDQSFVVPAGVTSLTAKLWGAGGGSASGACWNHSTGRAGAGAFVEAIMTVTPGETLTAVVGAGGVKNQTTARYGFGGYGSNAHDLDECMGGTGGGLAGIFRGTVDQPSALAIAGGGGGAASGNSSLQSGGAAGPTGADGLRSGAASSLGGGGASASAAGTAGAAGSRSTGNAGGILWGSVGANGQTNYASGFGGAGYFGGGGGSWADGGGHGAGGGGGSNFVAGTATTVANTAGTEATPPEQGNSAYIAGVGEGAQGGQGAGNDQTGGNALIVLSYSTGGSTKTLNKTSDYEIEHLSDTSVKVTKTSAGSANVKIRLI